MRIFKNNKNQIRSGWKIIIVFLSFYLITYTVSIIPMVIYMVKYMFQNLDINGGAFNINFDFSGIYDTSSSIGFVLFLIQCVSLIFSVVLFWKILDKKPIRDIGLKNIKKSFKELCLGLLFGALSMSIVFLILILTGSAKVTTSFINPNFSMSLVTSLILFIFVGISEEMFSRGYCIKVLEQTNKKWIPLIVSSAIFSIMHGVNPGVTILSIINIFLVGILLGYMFIKTNNLWLPIGYHITWNYFQGNVFGFLVSGTTTEGLYTTESIGNTIISGGNFGPEGGIIVTIVVLISILLVYFLTNKNSNIGDNIS
ncbi:putative membrane protein [Clostridium bornimense]|uniref:Putative membrane protein n=1 Tax=Clostridium bornimense TaxID=1216932 RepID=W6S6S6_9CLOT|nr:CPBP family intramembrane glutamic endopeptidase [Clostridium bornimense]CDM70087.1 putative membrane protein [Clostridium bornimense]